MLGPKEILGLIKNLGLKTMTGNDGTSPIDGFQVVMGLQHDNLSMKSHIWLWDTYGTGPIGVSQPDMGLHA